MSSIFLTEYIDGVNRELKGTGAVCKRSTAFTKAAVIGVPGKQGAVIVSIDNESTNYPDRDVWLCHYAHDLTPKEVADGNINFGLAEEKVFLYWNDFKEYLKEVFG